MTTAIQFITFMLLMLITGVFWGPWFALHRSLHTFTATEFVKIVKTLGANMGNIMRILMPTTILVLIVSVFTYPLKNFFYLGFTLIILSLICILISLIITMAVEVPIVTEIQQQTAETLPHDWEAKRDRWVKFHFFRMVSGIASFAFFTASILVLCIY